MITSAFVTLKPYAMTTRSLDPLGIWSRPICIAPCMTDPDERSPMTMPRFSSWSTRARISEADALSAEIRGRMQGLRDELARTAREAIG